MGNKEKILIIGASGQIGIELTETLQQVYGINNVIASDVKKPRDFKGVFEELDVLDGKKLGEVVFKHKVSQVYLLAALLSASAEKNPLFAWKLNMEGLFNVLD